MMESLLETNGPQPPQPTAITNIQTHEWSRGRPISFQLTAATKANPAEAEAELNWAKPRIKSNKWLLFYTTKF